jgi:hypothetical protein
MPALDVTKVLGPGWQIEDSRKITTVVDQNELAFPSGSMTPGCDLANYAKVISDPDPYSASGRAYVPPIGWTVHFVIKPQGFMQEAVYADDQIWESPTGKAWSLSNCTAVETGEDVEICKTHADCKSGKACIDGYCRGCSSDGDCKAGAKCVNKICVSYPEEKKGYGWLIGLAAVGVAFFFLSKD